MARPVLFIFARAPSHGAVKTRLGRDIGASAALRFHRNALEDAVRRFRRCPRIDVVLAVTPRQRLQAAAWPRGIVRVDQGRGNLGQRMLRTLRRAGHRPALLIGSDVPDARVHHVSEALDRLTRAPYVLGPTEDGGYWLIGARRPWLLGERLLDGVRWSSEYALGDTQARLPGAALLRETLWDVDDASGWSRLNLRQDLRKLLYI